MQKYLNEDATYFSKQFKKRPWIPLLIILLIASGIALFTVSLLCNIKFPCTDQQQNYSLIFGLNICLLSVTFIGIPLLLYTTLNCIWPLPPILPITTMTPLPSRSRSNSKEKTPPSPKGPVPKHASKSFREFHSEA
jgi:hypothetical protein